MRLLLLRQTITICPSSIEGHFYTPSPPKPQKSRGFLPGTLQIPLPNTFFLILIRVPQNAHAGNDVFGFSGRPKS